MRAGTEPANARSAPRLRITLAAGAFVLFALLSWRALAVGEGGRAYGLAVVLALIAISAAIDIVVLVLRLRRGAYRGS